MFISAGTVFGVMSSNVEKGVGEQKRVVAVVPAESSVVRTRAQTPAPRNAQCLTDTVLARSAAARVKLVRSGSRGGVTPVDVCPSARILRVRVCRW